MDKNNIGKYLLVICFFFSSFVVSAQEYTKTKINGKDYYQYVVEKGEGFYSISKKFGVNKEELLSNNPSVQDGLKVGQAILIPVKENVTPPPSSPSSTSPSTESSSPKTFLNHTVEINETVFSISRTYNVNIDTVYKYNPETRSSLKRGTIVRIPENSKKNIEKHEVVKETPKPKYTLHTVQEGETLYGISKKYNVTVAQILSANPTIANEVIIKGDVLKIPQGKEVNVTQTIPTKKTDSLSIASKKGQKIFATKKSDVKVAFLLPFMLNSGKPDPAADKFVEFYQGALMAADSLKKQGLSLDIYVYDTDRSEKNIQDILAKPELKTVDLIIGPAYTVHVKPVAEFAKQNNIKLIIPFSSKTDETFSNPFVYQCNTNQNVIDEQTAKGFVKTFKGKNIIVLTFKDGAQDSKKQFYNILQKELKDQNVAYKSLVYDNVKIEDINKLMVTNNENVVLLLTTNPATLSKVMPILNTITTDFSLFGFPEWLQLTKTQEDIFVHDTYIYSSFYIDYNNQQTHTFFREYAHLFGEETIKSIPHYNLLGYDITFYFINGIRKYGKTLDANTDNNTKTLQTKFRFEKVNDNGGYMNESLFLIKYKNDSEQKIDDQK
jgi:LysM repeat protein